MKPRSFAVCERRYVLVGARFTLWVGEEGAAEDVPAATLTARAVTSVATVTRPIRDTDVRVVMAGEHKRTSELL